MVEIFLAIIKASHETVVSGAAAAYVCACHVCAVSVMSIELASARHFVFIIVISVHSCDTSHRNCFYFDSTFSPKQHEQINTLCY